MRSRRGFTLIEIMVVTVLTVIVVGGMLATLTRQQRFYRGASQLLEARSQVQQAAAILPADLRGVSSAGGDILSMTETEVVFRTTFGSSVVCALVTGEIVLPPTDPAAGNAVSNWGVTPAPGDAMAVWDEGASSRAGDDGWAAYTVGNNVVLETGTCPVTTGLTTLADATKNVLRLNTSAPLAATIAVGAPVRFLREVRYQLFQAGNGKWYLGYCSPTCDGAGPQPIAGPFVPFGSTNGPGVRFTYLDSNGVPTTVPSQVAQVNIVVSAQTSTKVSMSGFQSSYVGDSLRFTIALRNRQ